MSDVQRCKVRIKVDRDDHHAGEWFCPCCCAFGWSWRYELAKAAGLKHAAACRYSRSAA